MFRPSSEVVPVANEAGILGSSRLPRDLSLKKREIFRCVRWGYILFLRIITRMRVDKLGCFYSKEGRIFLLAKRMFVGLQTFQWMNSICGLKFKTLRILRVSKQTARKSEINLKFSNSKICPNKVKKSNFFVLNINSF